MPGRVNVPKTPMERIYLVTGCRTQSELAALLGIRQSTVSEAVKKCVVPTRWIRKLTEMGVNAEWVMTGTGSQYVMPAGASRSVQRFKKTIRPSDATVVLNILRCIPTQDLIAELRRRNVPCGDEEKS